jgi:hypothetical protein
VGIYVKKETLNIREGRKTPGLINGERRMENIL